MVPLLKEKDRVMSTEISNERLMRTVLNFDPNESQAFSLAKQILGSDFIAPKEPRGFTPRQINALIKKLPGKSILEWCLQNGYLVAPGNPRQELIACVVEANLVDPHALGSCLILKRNLLREPNYVPSWYLIRKNPYASAPHPETVPALVALNGDPCLLSVSEVLWVWDLYIAQQNAPTEDGVLYDNIGASNEGFARTIFDDYNQDKFKPVGWRL